MDQSAATADVAIKRPTFGPALRALAAEVSRDRLLLGIVVAYAAAAGLFCLLTGRAGYFHPFVYMKMWVLGLVTGAGTFALVWELPNAVRADPKAPLAGFVARLRGWMSARVVAGLILFFAAGLFTGVFTSMKSLLNDLVAFRADALLAQLDAVVHFGVDPWKLLQPVLGHEAVTRSIQKLYLMGWAMLLVGFTAAAALAPKLAHVRTRFFLIYFGAWILLGNVVAAAFMSGGPVYFGQLTGDYERFSEQMQYLSFSHGLANSSYDLQRALWALYEEGVFHMGTGISAFPSLHVAMMTLFTLTAFQLDRRIGWAVGAFALMILAGSVHLAWHYAIDGYFSAAVIALAWVGLGRLELKRAA
jgi:hypothetical protein